VDLLTLQSDPRAAKLKLAGEHVRRRPRPGRTRGSVDFREAVECATNRGVHRNSLPGSDTGVTDAALG
jgi:hypothetical protein